MTDHHINIIGYSLAELEQLCNTLQEPKYRAKQLATWIYRKGANSFQEMSDLSVKLRDQLSAVYCLEQLIPIRILQSQDQRTEKFLFRLADTELVETVLMRTNYGVSVCVSSQVGCAMGCKFCASTLRGVKRNLTAGEMLAQVLFANRQAPVTHVVIMGSGEPLNNYVETVKFLQLLHADYSLGLSYRNLTISTCGIIPKIYALAELKLPINLAISLHAPNNELRNQLMPINQQYPIETIVEAAQHYAQVTKRQITYEYIMLDGVNDSPEQAQELGRLLQNQLALVNLIPFNAVAEHQWKRSPQKRVQQFQRLLQHYLPTTIRYERGTDIAGACGQLRNQATQNQ